MCRFRQNDENYCKGEQLLFQQNGRWHPLFLSLKWGSLTWSNTVHESYLTRKKTDLWMIKKQPEGKTQRHTELNTNIYYFLRGCGLSTTSSVPHMVCILRWVAQKLKAASGCYVLMLGVGLSRVTWGVWMPRHTWWQHRHFPSSFAHFFLSFFNFFILPLILYP